MSQIAESSPSEGGTLHREVSLMGSMDVQGYDYFDFGCSSGGNMEFIKRFWPSMRGLGIDIDEEKIIKARAAGHDARVQDILRLSDTKLVRFVTMSHFLEHLDGVECAGRMIRKAVAVADDFVFIRQPWFDADGVLLRHGLKFYWSHWRGHRNKMTSLDFHSILSAEVARKTIRGFEIYGRRHVDHSSHEAIIPLAAPVDQHAYDQKLHGPKGAVELPTRAYCEIVIRIDIGEVTGAQALLSRLQPLELVCGA